MNTPKWHTGAHVINNGASDTNTRHHPVFSQIGDGWMWLSEYTTGRVWWVHESGLHLCVPTGPGSAWGNPNLWPEFAAALTGALVHGITGFCRVDVDKSGRVTLSKSGEP